MGTAEVESALVAHPKVAESAVVGYPHAIKGQGIYAYVTLMTGEAATEELRKELRGRYQVGDIISRSPSMQRIFKILPQIADSDSTILLQGETGTGKELIARTIYQVSPRKDQAFVPVNCASIPETLFEREFFGHRKGAFTGALKEGKAGLFELAHGGTIFLDEISTASPSMQVKLLRVLEDLGAPAPGYNLHHRSHRQEDSQPPLDLRRNLHGVSPVARAGAFVAQDLDR